MGVKEQIVNPIIIFAAKSKVLKNKSKLKELLRNDGCCN